MQGKRTSGQGLFTDTAIPEKGVQENTPQSSWGELRRPGKQRAACGLFSVAASPTAFFPLPASSGAPPASTHRQSAVEQTGKPERKSDEPQSPAETSSECGADTGSENKRHAQGKKKNDKLAVHAHLSGRSRTFEEKRKESFLSGISRSHLGAPRQAPPHIYQGSLSFYGESPLLAKLRGGAVCRF